MEFEIHDQCDVVAAIDEDGNLAIKAGKGVAVLQRNGVAFIISEVSISDFGVTRLIRKGDKVTITF